LSLNYKALFFFFFCLTFLFESLAVQSQSPL
jgi:hypothetical protein